jgi:hypothetical protein
VKSTAVEYHWVITLTGTTGPQQHQATAGDHGVVTRDPATSTRKSICDELVAAIRDGFLQRTGMLLENYNIVHFQLEPNQL